MQKSCRRAAQKIKKQVLDLSHAGFDVISEDEQHPHVVDDVEPAAMQKHGGVDRIPLICWVADQFGGDQAPGEDEILERVRSHLQLIEKCQHICSDQRQVDKRECVRARCIVKREHGLFDGFYLLFVPQTHQLLIHA